MHKRIVLSIFTKKYIHESRQSRNMTIDETNLLQEKAKTRKDGVYSFRGNLYVVKDSKFIAFANYFGECYQRMGAFNVQIGKVERYDRKQKLMDWLRSQ